MANPQFLLDCYPLYVIGFHDQQGHKFQLYQFLDLF